MFTGIVQGVGEVVSLKTNRLTLQEPGLWPTEPFTVGESVAVEGCCLTVACADDDGLHFDLSEETLARTSLGGFTQGAKVNLERAMKASDRFGGHIVQGHVDCLGTVESVTKAPNSWAVTVSVPEGGQYLAQKGSICLSGVSLTLVEPAGDSFQVHLVPHTVAVTTIAGWQAGTKVNVEFDALAKHVERLLAWRG